jgi:hypothetical protein
MTCPESISNPLRGSNSDFAQYSITPSLRVAGFEDEDENQAPHEGARSCGAKFVSVPPAEHELYRPFRAGLFLDRYQGLKPLAESCNPFGINQTPAAARIDPDCYDSKTSTSAPSARSGLAANGKGTLSRRILRRVTSTI